MRIACLLAKMQGLPAPVNGPATPEEPPIDEPTPIDDPAPVDAQPYPDEPVPVVTEEPVQDADEPPSPNLTDWLLLLESRHPREIELGLERVAHVASVLQLSPPAPLVISIAGTNGKGPVAQT